MINVLFICEHNSARSQMAEAYLNTLSEGKMRAESAGLEPGSLNPYVVEVLKEEGIDITSSRTQCVFDLYKEGRQFDFVIAVCSAAVSAKCPIFPGRTIRLNWPFADPSSFSGSDKEILHGTRTVRDEIKKKIQAFVDDYQEKGLKIFLENQH
ncbi:MAG: arsenate reductase ArsC [Desulfocapsaceae bacterium]|nr:arsenate reductase ArsC [Desulfocapsaceae bacterium]